MADAMEVSTASDPFDLNSIHCEVRELLEIRRSYDEFGRESIASDSEKLLKDFAIHLESKVKEILSECSDVSFLGIEDIEAYIGHLKEELKNVEAESSKISKEIESLGRLHVEDSNRLDSDLEELNCSLDLVASQWGQGKAIEDLHADCSKDGEDQSDLINIHEEQKFELVKLESEIEKNNIILNSLQDLDSMCRRFDVLEQIEDSLTGLKVIEYDENCFRLSMQTYIPKLEELLSQQISEDVNEPSEVNHELLIELVDGTMELKNVEIFPNDVYIGDILDATKSFRQFYSQFTVVESQSSLQWFVRNVQDRIILSTLRRFLVKNAHKSSSTCRHFFEYLDRDEMIVAHLLGGVDAFLKVSQGWPLSNSPLKLISLKSSDHQSKQISLSFFCKVEEMANSLDVPIRQNLSSFVEAVEKTLVEQMRTELHSDVAPGK
ncbi:uncharacterized protein LOC123205766 isoform X1 [Mangifera indica]|uniref:uncharacterized protein LOC123205766 isoform X1 n=1 Tax=Mangifera indica TaxID=29780 RepID=UPI001CF998AC|nr:uncharacterized protein LOC123205766 isoform X1 [Mangifera indica]